MCFFSDIFFYLFSCIAASLFNKLTYLLMPAINGLLVLIGYHYTSVTTHSRMR